MEGLARLFLILEILFVNLIISHRCLGSKHSIMRVIVELTIFTVFIFLVSFSIRFKLNLPYFNGVILILIGLTYLFPLKHLYQESLGKTLVIMFFSWIHTMTVNFFSIQISTLFGHQHHFQIALIVQTIIYLFSTPVIIKLVNYKFLYIVKNIPIELNKYLVTLSSVQFAIILVIILCFTGITNSAWKLVAVVLVALTTALSYHLIYIIVRNLKNVKILEYLAYTDNLTGIKNRLALFLDCDELISENKPFNIIYMDLDNFKKVNDTYGHSVGDDYLKYFTQATIETVGNRGSVYRLSGDEFVCLYMEDKVSLFLETFDKKIIDFLRMDIPFLGVSIGYAKFPQDGNSIDELIKKADRVMYKVKKQAKQSI